MNACMNISFVSSILYVLFTICSIYDIHFDHGILSDIKFYLIINETFTLVDIICLEI